MKYSNLEKAAKVLPVLKELDDEIIKLEKAAFLIAEGKASSVFDLKVKDSTAIKEKKDILEEDGSMKDFGIMDRSIYNMMQMHFPSFGNGSKAKPDNYDFEFKYDLNEGTLLRLLAILKIQKEEERSRCIKKLNKLGFAND